MVSNARFFYILQLSDSSIHTSIWVKITSNIAARLVANNDEPRVDVFAIKGGNKQKTLEQNLGQFTKLMVGSDHAMFIDSILKSKPLSIEERIGLRYFLFISKTLNEKYNKYSIHLSINIIVMFVLFFGNIALNVENAYQLLMSLIKSSGITLPPIMPPKR